MMNYKYIWNKKQLFQSFTGLSQKQFNRLLKEFTPIFNNLKQSQKKNRIRAIGGGRRSETFKKISHVLAYILFYTRNYPTFSLCELFYELDRSTLHYWCHLGLKALEQTVENKIPLPTRKRKSINELFQQIPELKQHIVDATEQPINRPKKNQEFYYSGKKKRHTIKRQIIITKEKKLIGISQAVEGKRHDKQLADDSKYLSHAPPESECLADTAYIGLTGIINTVKIATPIKKPKIRELTKEEKEVNKQLSSIRVGVEHVIGHLKFNRIFREQIRYRLPIEDRISNIVGGVYNFKLITT